MSTNSAAISVTSTGSASPTVEPRSLGTSAPPARSSARPNLLARLWRAMHRPPRPPRPAGVPLIHNRPEQFGQSCRYPDGTWFHGC